jgi:hypothetical protein
MFGGLCDRSDGIPHAAANREANQVSLYAQMGARIFRLPRRYQPAAVVSTRPTSRPDGLIAHRDGRHLFRPLR